MIVDYMQYRAAGNFWISTRWFGMQLGDDGQAASGVEQMDRSVQVFGDFGAGGSVTIEGSLDGEHWATLSDPQGNPLVITSAKIEQITELTMHIRPRVTTGDGTTSLSVIIAGKAAK